MRLIPDINWGEIAWAALPWKRVAAYLAALVVSLWIIWPNNPPEAPHQLATPAPAVAALAKVQTPIKTNTVKARPAAAKKALRLPSAIVQDPAKVVLDSTIVKADRRDTVVTTVLDVDTGDTLTLESRQPRPWLAVDRSGSIWMGAGYKQGQPVMRAEIEQGLVSVKALTVSARASVDMPFGVPGATEWFAGIGVRMDY